MEKKLIWLFGSAIHYMVFFCLLFRTAATSLLPSFPYSSYNTNQKNEPSSLFLYTNQNSTLYVRSFLLSWIQSSASLESINRMLLMPIIELDWIQNNNRIWFILMILYWWIVLCMFTDSTHIYTWWNVAIVAVIPFQK